MFLTSVLFMCQITDEGASALGAVLAGRIGLRSVDLRGNRISKQVMERFSSDDREVRALPISVQQQLKFRRP